MTKKRVAILTHGLSTNGIESLLIEIFRNISLDSLELDVIMALDPQEIPVHEQEAVALGVRTIHLCDLDGFKKKLAYSIGLYKQLKKGNYDVIHANMNMLNGICLLIASLAGIRKRICHAHNTLNTTVKVLSAKGVYYSVMRLLIHLFSTHRIGCSEKANTCFFGKKPALVIPNGIDLARFQASDARIEPAEIGLEGGVHYLATVGRFTEQKNPFFIVDIIAALKEIRTDVKLVWMGSGSLEKDVHARAEKLGVKEQILFLGARTDVHRILPHCEVFLLPSKWEGFGIVLLEAQAAGLTCVASQEIPHDADAGGCVFVSLKENASVWAQTVSALLDSSRPVADPNRLRAFDIRETARTIQTLYES